MKYYMCLDLSVRNTGILIVSFDGDNWSSIVQMCVGAALDKMASVEDRVLRIQGVIKRLEWLSQKYDFESVIIEGPSYGSKFAQVELGGLHYAVYSFCVCNQLPILLYPPKKARSLAFGRGSVPKEFKCKGDRTKKWVLEEIKKKVQVAPKNEHVRDALVLWLAFLEEKNKK